MSYQYVYKVVNISSTKYFQDRIRNLHFSTYSSEVGVSQVLDPSLSVSRQTNLGDIYVHVYIVFPFWLNEIYPHPPTPTSLLRKTSSKILHLP